MQTLYNIMAKKIRPIELALVFKKMLRIKRRDQMIKENHWFIDPVSDFGFRMLNDGEYEKEMTDHILSNLDEGDVFVDLGANEGYFSILASKKVKAQGRVFSIEPQIRLWPVILNNIQLNRLDNVTLMPYAISAKPDKIKLILSPSINTGSSTFTEDFRRKYWPRQVINSSTLDDLFLHQDFIIKVLKIDIEGFEFFALKGAVGLLASKRIANIVIEMHDAQLMSLGQSASEIHEFLLSYGYKEIGGVYKSNA